MGNKKKKIDYFIANASEEFNTGIFNSCGNKVELIEAIGKYLKANTVDGKYNNHQLSDVIMSWESEIEEENCMKSYRNNSGFATAGITFTIIASAVAARVDKPFESVMYSILIIVLALLFINAGFDIKQSKRDVKKVYKNEFYKLCIKKAKEILA